MCHDKRRQYYLYEIDDQCESKHKKKSATGTKSTPLTPMSITSTFPIK